MTSDDVEKWAKYARVAEVFTPGAPIDSLDLFAGRIEQIKDVLTAVVQRGQHLVLYGERGVGKTSLAKFSTSSSPDEARGTPLCAHQLWYERRLPRDLAEGLA